MTTERNIIIHAGQTFELSLDYAGTVGRGQRMHIRAADASAAVIAILTHNGDANARVIYDGSNSIDVTIGASVSGEWLVGANRVEWVYDIEDYDLSDADDVVITHRGKAIVYGNRTRPAEIDPAPTPNSNAPFVRWDIPQSLTDEEKEQARDNIGAGTGGGGGISDGDKGDITVSSSGTVWTIDNGAVTFAKMQAVSANVLIGNDASGTTVEEIACTAAGRALLDDADASAQRTTLGLGTAAVAATGDFEAAGAVSTHNAVTTAHGISVFGASLVDDADASAARTTLGLGTAATAATGDFAAASHNHAASAIDSGTIDTARLGSGTANSGTFLRGDQTWASVSASPGGSSGQAQYNDAGAFAGLPVWREDANTVAQRNGSTAQVAYYYRDATDTSNYERLAILPGAAAGWMQIVAQTAGTGADNFGVALTPAGTGAISAHVPDSTSAGGNARGASSVDLQLNRFAATQVCGGAYSGILSGYSNSIAASALYSVLGGGSGNSISNSYYGVVAGGYSNSASGNNATVSGGGYNTASGENSWIPGGWRATTRGLKGSYAYSAGRRSADGDAQVIGQPVRRTTTDATPVSLATDGTPAATTVMVLPANSTLIATATVVARDSSGNSAGWIAQALFKRDGSNNTTRLGSATVTAIGTPDAAINTATIDLVANNTLESAEIQVTGVAATTIYWVGELKCVQVA